MHGQDLQFCGSIFFVVVVLAQEYLILNNALKKTTEYSELVGSLYENLEKGMRLGIIFALYND